MVARLGKGMHWNAEMEMAMWWMVGWGPGGVPQLGSQLRGRHPSLGPKTLPSGGGGGGCGSRLQRRRRRCSRETRATPGAGRWGSRGPAGKAEEQDRAWSAWRREAGAGQGGKTRDRDSATTARAAPQPHWRARRGRLPAGTRLLPQPRPLRSRHPGCPAPPPAAWLAAAHNPSLPSAL